MPVSRFLMSSFLLPIPPLPPLVRPFRRTAVPSFRPPFPWPRRARASSKSADVDENAGRQQRDHLAGTAIGHERQGQPGSRDQTERHGHVHERRESNGSGKTGGEILPER